MGEPLICPPRDESDFEAVRGLLVEYVSDPQWGACFASYLAQQAFDRELATLRETYAPPAAGLLLAWAGDIPAGCVAYKPLDAPVVCEMKRLYVRPAFRGSGLGSRLVAAVCAAAAAAGYERMRLDTLPSMRSAQRLYRASGFHEIPSYCDNPVEGAIFMERALPSPPPTC